MDWYAANRSWWEPLSDRAPVVESAWGDPASGAKVSRSWAQGRSVPPRRVPCRRRRSWSPAPAVSSATTLSSGSPARYLTAGSKATRAPADLGDGPALDVVAAPRSVLDVTRREDVLAALLALRPQLVVHAAAFTNVDGCELDPDRAFAVNALGTRHVAEAARRYGAHLVVVSTRLRLRRHGRHVRTSNGTRPNPLSVYGLSKLGTRARGGSGGDDRPHLVGQRRTRQEHGEDGSRARFGLRRRRCGS